MTVKLPASVAEYFAAHNGDDAGRVAACFAEDGTVRDEGRDIRGREAIHAWAAETQRRYRFHAEIIRVEAVAGRTSVTAHLTGDFPGNPVDLDFRFELPGTAIVLLEIG